MHAALTTSCSLGCAAGAAAPRPAARRSAGPVGPAPRLGAPLRHAAPRPRSSLAAAAEGKAAPPQAAADTGPGKLISAMEIPAFIPRTDLIQQLYRWGFIEANDAKVRGGKKVEMGEMKKTAAAPAAGRGMRARTSAPLSQLLPCSPPPPLSPAPAPSLVAHTPPLPSPPPLQVKYGAPLRVTPFTTADGIPWGFNVDVLRDGAPTATLSVGFDLTNAQRHEWVGRGEDGFPVLQGKVEQVSGKFFEIRKTCDLVIDEDTRGVIRMFCSKLVTALNRYYAFGSCFVDDST